MMSRPIREAVVQEIADAAASPPLPDQLGVETARKVLDDSTSWIVNENVMLGELGVVGRWVGGELVVSVAGELDMLTAPSLCPAVERLMSEGACGMLVIDLAEVVFLGSAGLRALTEHP